MCSRVEDHFIQPDNIVVVEVVVEIAVVLVVVVVVVVGEDC